MKNFLTVVFILLNFQSFSQNALKEKKSQEFKNKNVNLESFDIGVSALLSPVSNCGHTNSEKVVVQVENFGADTSYNFTVSYRINSGTRITENFKDSIAPRTKIVYTFKQRADLSAYSDYTFIANTNFSWDTLNRSNDTTIAIINGSKSLYLDSFTFFNNFESDSVINLMTIYDSNNDGSTWKKSDEMPKSGRFGISAFSSPDGTNKDWLITPCLSLITGQTYVLDYYYNGIFDDNFKGNLKVMIGKKADSLETLGTVLKLNSNISGQVFRHDSILFTVNENGGYRIGFLDFSTFNLPNVQGLTIDKLTVRKLKSNNIIVSEILNPINTCNDLSTEKFTVQLKNIGTSEQSNFYVTIQVNDNKSISEKISANLLPGKSMNYTFTGSPIIDVNNTYELKTYTSLGDKGQVFSKKIYTIAETSFPNLKPYSLSFDLDNDIQGWNLLDLDGDGNNWSKRKIAREFSDEISAINALSYFYPNGSFNKNKDYAISNCFLFQQNIPIYLGFYYRLINSAQNPNPKIQIFLSKKNSPDSISSYLDTIVYTSGFKFIYNAIKIIPKESGIHYVGFKPQFEQGQGGAQFFIEDLSLGRNNPSKIDNYKNSIISLYPNPTKGIFEINFDGDGKEYHFSVLDALGRVVFQKIEKIDSGKKIKIDLSNFEKGVYSVQIKNHLEVYTFKLLLL